LRKQNSLSWVGKERAEEEEGEEEEEEQAAIANSIITSCAAHLPPLISAMLSCIRV
jgi:hypothetical protein